MATTASLLSQIESAIEALLTGGASNYTIGNRSVTKLDLADLMEQRRILQSELDREIRGTARLAKFQRVRR